MNEREDIDPQINQLAVVMLAMGGPATLAPFVEATRFERMAQEMQYAIRNTSGADMAQLMGYLASDTGAALLRRVTGLFELAGKLIGGTVNELEGMLKAYSNDGLQEHLGERIGIASAITAQAISNGAKGLYSLAQELRTNPADAGPKLLVLVLASVAASGGVDGNGGVPDLDIPLMGIGEHRSPFTHSILIGSLLETALLLLTRVVLCTHKNLPLNHDPLWESLANQSVGILNAAGKGASIGIAYHLMVDAVVQPGTYHGVPFDMPLEAHQTILAVNAAGELTAVREYPDEEFVTATPEIIAAHKRFRATRMSISSALKDQLTHSDIAILEKYGLWLRALAKRTISPTTLAQVQFLKVVQGRCPPTTAYEKAWVALVEATHHLAT